MLLTFKEQFVDLIQSGIKIHTIRSDPKGRFEPGKKLHFWKDNPRNPQKEPYRFKVGNVVSVQDCLIDPNNGFVLIDGAIIFDRLSELNLLARNDGFESFDQMVTEWFDCRRTYKIVHWTDFVYTKEHEESDDLQDYIPF